MTPQSHPSSPPGPVWEPLRPAVDRVPGEGEGWGGEVRGGAPSALIGSDTTSSVQNTHSKCSVSGGSEVGSEVKVQSVLVHLGIWGGGCQGRGGVGRPGVVGQLLSESDQRHYSKCSKRTQEVHI